jgi:hypothetical protein
VPSVFEEGEKGNDEVCTQEIARVADSIESKQELSEAQERLQSKLSTGNIERELVKMCMEQNLEGAIELQLLIQAVHAARRNIAGSPKHVVLVSANCSRR